MADRDVDVAEPVAVPFGWERMGLEGRRAGTA